ncbi:MAG: response regulator [Promethearchaeota archaeon]
MAEKNTILIVDDEPDIVNLTEKFLKLGNFETLTCGNGRDALEIIEERYEEIALVLLDIMMPGTSGYSVLKTIKENEKFKDIIVILFTVKSFNEDIQKGKKLGADGYITKPFSGKDLLNSIKEFLAN